MKKILILIALALLFVPAVDTKAATLMTGSFVGDATGSYTPPDFMFDENLMSSEITKDEAGRFKSGYFYYNNIINGWHSQRNNLYATENGYLYITRKVIENNTLDEGLTTYLYKLWTSDECDRIYVDANYEYNKENDPPRITWYEVYHYVPSGANSYMQIGSVNMPINCNSELTYEYDEVKNKLGFYCTNLPVFNEEDTEAIERYKQSGDYSGSVNGGSLDYSNPDVDYDDSVELPRNPMTYGKIRNYLSASIDTDISDIRVKACNLNVRWYPPVKDLEQYSYDVRAKIHYYDYSDKKYYDTDFILYVSNFPYSGRSMVDISTGLPVTRTSDIPEDFNVGEEFLKKQGFEFVTLVEGVTSEKRFGWRSLKTGHTVEIKTVNIQIRNRVGNKCSNWASVTSTAGGGSSVYVHDDEDNYVPTDDYDNSNIDNNDNHITDDFADKNSNKTDFDASLKGILNYIRSGFGLLGDNGIIALMSRTFLYLPASFWTILNFFIAMLVTICIIKAIKEVLF